VHSSDLNGGLLVFALVVSHLASGNFRLRHVGVNCVELRRLRRLREMPSYDYIHISIVHRRIAFAEIRLHHLLLHFSLVASTETREFTIDLVLFYLECVDILVVNSSFVLSHQHAKPFLLTTLFHLDLQSAVIIFRSLFQLFFLLLIHHLSFCNFLFYDAGKGVIFHLL